MASISAPKGSFVQFDETDIEHCMWGTVRATLPVYSDDDIAFQFFVSGTEAEIDELVNFYNTAVTVGIAGIDDETFTEPTLIEFAEEPERFRISDTAMLYNWTAGLPGFQEVIDVGQCFKIQVTVNLSGDGSDVKTSNRFIRVGDDCYTSVLQYGNDDNAFGFNYCYSSDFVPPDGGGGGGGGTTNPPPQNTACEPMAIQFTNESTWVMPYTTEMADAYGSTPTVQVWLADVNGDYVKTDGLVKMDAYPPNYLEFDFGGTASGIIIIK
jgi:hypothetical protein